MRLRKERIIFSKNKKKVKEIYYCAFPKNERMPFPLMQIMSLLWNTDLYAYYDEDTLVGFTYSAHLLKQTFIMFFAVEDRLRSHGYGGKILDEVASMHPTNKVIVSIEPVSMDSISSEICDSINSDLALRKRRKAFYERNGFSDTGYRVKLAGVEQEVLVRNGEFHPGSFRAFFILYSCLAVIPKIWKATE